jgi:hypothetical protein
LSDFSFLCYEFDVATWAQFDIVKGELGDTRVELHEKRQRLAYTAGGTKDGDLGALFGDRLALVMIAGTRASFPGHGIGKSGDAQSFCE